MRANAAATSLPPEVDSGECKVRPDEAKRLVEEARSQDGLRGASHDDLLAPHEERESYNHEQLRRVLDDHYGISLSLEDFLIDDEMGGSPGQTVYPLALIEVEVDSPLLIINCHYTMDKSTKTSLRFQVDPQSVTFHLFEPLDMPGE